MDSGAAIVDEMQVLVRAAAEPWHPGDSIKAGLGRAARATGIGYRRVKTFWYGERATVTALEADALRGWYRRWTANELARIDRRREQLEAEWLRLGGDA